jgi:hypothetical protein
VVFEDDRAPATRARFSAAGVYELRLRAADGELAAADRVTVLVTNPNGGGGVVVEEFRGAFSGRQTMASIEVVSDGGPATVELSFTGRARHGRQPTMILKVYGPDGRLIASQNGKSPITMNLELSLAGTYTFVIRGPRDARYALGVTHRAL